jgi:TPR repeat protein
MPQSLTPPDGTRPDSNQPATAVGQGVRRNNVEAAKWFRLSANQGYAEAQRSLALLYATGQGVPQDYVLAHMWLNLSAAQGNEPAAYERDSLAEQHMTPAQIAEAQKLAREWKPSGGHH